MNATWRQFAASLRSDETSDAFARLAGDIGETPEFAETPADWNDTEGRTRSYRFPRSGIEIGFRMGRLDHVHFFVRPRDGYDAYRRPLEDGIGPDHNEQGMDTAMGVPDACGGPKQDALLGFRRRWVRYKRMTHSVRYEFEPGDGIAKVTLIAE